MSMCKVFCCVVGSRAKANRVLPRQCTGHSKHPLPTTQEKTLHVDITRRPTSKSDWLHSLQPKMEKLYTVSKNKTGSWLYRAFPPLAAKNIINIISVLTIWWYPCVESSLVLQEEGVCYDQCVLLVKFISLCSPSFCTPRPNFPVTPGVSWLPTFSFQSPIMKRTSFFGC